MQAKSAVGLVVGPATTRLWGQILILPMAYGVVEIEDNEGQAQARGVAILSTLGEALSLGPTSLHEIENIAQRATSDVVRTILLFVPVGSVVYIVLVGEGMVILKREHEFAPLMIRPGAISGEMRPGDSYILASRGFVQSFTSRELASVFDHQTATEAAEKLTMLLHEKTSGDGSAALVYQVTDIVESETIQPEEPTELDRPPVSPSSRNSPAKVWLRKVIVSHPRGVRFVEWIGELRRSPQKRKAAAVIMLCALFVISVVLGVVKQRANKQADQVNAVIADANHAFEEGIALLDLNAVKGRERLADAKKLLEPVRAKTPARSVDGRKIAQLYDQITNRLQESMHEAEVSLQLFYDVALLRAGGRADAISLDGDTIALVDRQAGAAYVLTLSSKNAQAAGGGDVYKGARLLALHGDRVYTLVDGGVHAFSVSDKKTTPLVIKKDEESWGTVTAISAFAGNVYLLDTQKGRIWKYVATEAGFSEIRQYLNPDTLPDLSQATGLAIDGSVWIGTTDGKILRFAAGADHPFVPKGVEPPFGDNLVVYTNDVLQNVYVLDTQKKRVVVLDKEGVYLAQYRWNEAMTVVNLVVSESLGKILLLAEGRLYSIDLQQ